ncbi:MAG: hypothetical protein E2O35_00270 [Proteobacteria bacterium]|nr:MAG: hypothetical protein E2O35_00270 [Pseudomonadota bacterium]
MITTSLEVGLLVLTLEFGLLCIAIAYYLYSRARGVEVSTVSEASELILNVTDSEDNRRLALQTVFTDNYNFEGDELDTAVNEFIQREKAFYNAVVGAFLGRGENKITDLKEEMTKVIAPWISMTPRNMVTAETADALAAEKSELEAELADTKKVLDEMMSEYNRAFRTEHTLDGDSEEPQSASLDNEIEEIDAVVNDASSVDIATTAAPETDSDAIGESNDDMGPASDANVQEDEQPETEVDETPLSQADKTMTADDLDDLMESLEVESVDDPKPVAAAG